MLLKVASSIEGRILSGDYVGRTCFIPRIGFDSADTSGLPSSCVAGMFQSASPLMVIIKSQGQSHHNRTVGHHLARPVFGHGQFYVALLKGSGREVGKGVYWLTVKEESTGNCYRWSEKDASFHPGERRYEDMVLKMLTRQA